MMGNVLNELSTSQQDRAKAAMQDIFMAAIMVDVLKAFEAFIATHGAKYPKAVEKLTQDRDSLLAFYDFPAEHWQHVRTTNPIESTFATVRHCTTLSRDCLSRLTFLGLAFKLMEEAEKSQRKTRGADRIKPLLDDVPFKDGIQAPYNRRKKQNLLLDDPALSTNRTSDLTLALAVI
jgi:putative transposase